MQFAHSALTFPVNHSLIIAFSGNDLCGLALRYQTTKQFYSGPERELISDVGVLFFRGLIMNVLQTIVKMPAGIHLIRTHAFHSS